MFKAALTFTMLVFIISSWLMLASRYFVSEEPIAGLQEIATIYQLINEEDINGLSLFQSKLTDPTWRDNVNSAKEICEHYLRYSLLDFDDNMAGILYNQCRLSLQIAQNQIEN